MKFVKTLLLWLFTLSFVTIQTLAVSPFAVLPENTAIVADLDGVLIERSPNMKRNIFYYAFPYYNPFQWVPYINAMNNTRINVLTTFQWLYNGMQDPTLLPYVAKLAKFSNKYHSFKPGTKKILEYLKTKGYEIDFATNKDPVSYDHIAESLGKDLTNLPWKVIVAQPGNNTAVMNQFKEFAQNTDLPDDYKALLQKTINAKPSGNIHHAPIPKPSSEYFDKLRNIVEKKNIIFFDDREENATAATRPNDNMIGIHFKNAIQFADELVRLGVLSEETDKEFLEDLRKSEPGVMETINKRTQQGWNYIKSFYSVKQKTA